MVRDMAVSSSSKSMVVIKATPCWRRVGFLEFRFLIRGSSIARAAIVHAEIARVDDQGKGFDLVFAAIKGVGEISAGPLIWRRAADNGDANGPDVSSEIAVVIPILAAGGAAGGLGKLGDAHLEADNLIGNDILTSTGELTIELVRAIDRVSR